MTYVLRSTNLSEYNGKASSFQQATLQARILQHAFWVAQYPDSVLVASSLGQAVFTWGLVASGSATLEAALAQRLHCAGGTAKPRSLLAHAAVSGMDSGTRATSSTRHSRDQQMEPDAPVTVALPDYCSGCGVKLQASDPTLPGFARIPKHLTIIPKEEGLDISDDDEDQEIAADAVSASAAPAPAVGALSPLDPQRAGPSASSSQARPPADARRRAEFDRLVESWADEGKPEGRHRELILDALVDDDSPNIVCARCFSLSHYGAIKSAEAEAANPEFDLARKVGRKIAFQKTRTAVILCVVDLSDFDGSLPREAVQALIPRDSVQPSTTGYNNYGRDQPQWSLVIAANKADLLPSQAKPQRLQAWVRQRTAQAGMPRPTDVHLVSSTKDSGVRDLLVSLHDAVGTHGDVWVVGAQNAGKSSLINAMHRAAHKAAPKKPLTIANLPGTTLGVLRVDGLMPPRCRMFDTPGVPHKHQLASILNPEEVALLHPKRRLQPRTYRIAAGNSLLIAGVGRIDVMEIPGATIYLTVFAASTVACHLSKTENVSERYQRLIGKDLAPPMGSAARMKQWQGLLPCELDVAGHSWRQSSSDIAIAGMGWIAVGVSGSAQLRAWAPPGVAVTTRAALIPDFSAQLERPGLGLRDKPKASKQQQLLQNTA